MDHRADLHFVRVVVITPSLPLPFGKADARWLHVAVTGLSSRGHDVVCLSCTEDDSEAVHRAADLAQTGGYEFRHIPLSLDPGPVTLRRFNSLRRPFNEYERVAGLRKAVDELAKNADVVHIEHLFTSRIGEGLGNAVTYLHHLEVIDWEERTDLDRRTRFVRSQMERATRQILRSTDRAIAATSRLAARATVINPRIRTAIVPVSIDPALYSTPPLPDEPIVGVIGSMHWYPSRSAADRTLTRLWPAIHAQIPEARLLVAGWGSAEYLGHRFPLRGAELMGEVGSPVDFFGAISTLLYPPARGSGFKIKVLEAMAYGRAVVSNQEGLEGLTDRGALVPLLAETDADFIEVTVELLRDRVLGSSLGVSGRAQVESQYSPEPAIDRLVEAYDRLGLAPSRTRSPIGVRANKSDANTTGDSK
ncbi:MAG: glycosyltransferase family 4 protein [Actinomycetia bacterium]|nr:glycosyltransferase family 4 protein [Actinomycetes bacterium]MCP4960997.1 glycosyltransferase family 4 protein [Actinomycetes bacterium]